MELLIVDDVELRYAEAELTLQMFQNGSLSGILNLLDVPCVCCGENLRSGRLTGDYVLKLIVD